LREEQEGWILAIDGADRLVLPVRDGAGPYVALPPEREPELRIVLPDR
jgi:hypothetical protein